MDTFALSSAGGSSGTAKFTGYVEWSVETTATAAKFTVSLYAGLDKSYTYGNMTGSIKKGNTTVASGTWGDADSDKITGTGNLICSGTFTVGFDASGIASASITAECSLWNNTGSFSNSPTITGSGTLSASAPYGASTILLGAASVQMGKNLLISLQRANSGCTHTLSYTFGGSTKEFASNVAGSYAWEVPDLADKCNNAVSGTCTISCTTYLSGKKLGTTTATVTLTVQDPTTPSVTDGTVTMGQMSTISCKRNSANFSVKLEFEFKGTTVIIGSGTLDSCSWTPSYDLAKLIPALTSGTGTLKCTTMNGTAEVGSQTATIEAVVPENDITRPKFDSDNFSVAPVSSLPEAFKGLFMRGKTGLTAAFGAGSDYSTIKEYAVTVGNQTSKGNPANIDLLVSEGNVKVTGKVTDARGFSTSVIITINVIPYRNPKITPYRGYSDVICERAMETGELNPNGTYLAIKAGKTYSSVLLNGKEMNSCQLRYRWKPNGAPAYTEWITLLADGSSETETSLLIGNVVTSLQTSYLVEIEALDALGGKHTLTFQIMTEAVSFVLYDGPDGAGFGKYPEAPHVVDIAAHMTLLVRGKMQVLGDDWLSLGLAEGISESAYEHGRKETGCHYLVTEGRHVHIAFNCAFAYAGTALIINAAPIPEENRPDRTVFSLCPANDRQFACVSVGTDGYIRVEWVQKATDTVLTGAADATWVDGYLCYWT